MDDKSLLNGINKMLRPIREDLAGLTKKVTNVEKNVAVVEKNVGVMGKNLAVVERKVTNVEKNLAVVEKNLAEVKRVQETQVLPSVVATEQTLKGYADMYKINDDNVKKLDKRLNIVEEELSIEPSPELTLGQVK